MERWVEQADGDGQSIHRLEDSLEVCPLHGKQLAERAAAATFLARDDHLAHRGDAIALEEHVLGSAQPDSLGAEAAGDARVAGRVRIGADPKLAHLVGPAQKLRVRLIERGL